MQPVKMTRAEYQAKYGVAPGGSSVTAPVVPKPLVPTSVASVSTPVSQAASPVKMTRAEYTAKFGVAPSGTPTPVEENKGSAVGGFLKGLISAPATLLARPIQAGAEILGATPEQVNKVNLGGIIAPVPQNTSDVVKDIGRGIQTVALGTGAPLATGAAFGAGASLENQGSNILSKEGLTDALVSTLVGMGAGKALDLVGKPLLDAAGKVIGTITPKIIQDVVLKGEGAVKSFMKNNELLGGIAKPLSEKIVKGAESFDKGIGKLFTGVGKTVKGAVQSQYPGATKENVAKHYEKIEVDRLMEPSKSSGKTYNKASDVVKDAKRRGIDLKRVAADNKVYASEHIKDGKFDTTSVADTLADETMSGGPEILRPALRAAEPGVPRVPISEVRNEIIARVSKIPDSKLSSEQKKSFVKKILQEYGDSSVTAARFKDGYSLENLYDSKLQTSSKIYKAPKTGGVQSISDTLTGQQKQIESQVFDDLLRKNAPKELGLDAYFKAQEGKFALANYLRTLDGNKAPQTLFQRGVRRVAQLGGATTGATVAGPFGMFSGYQFGGIVADTFASASNPVKVAYLKSIGKSEPEIYEIMREFVSDTKAKVLSRLKLQAPGESTVPNLAKMQNKQGAVEMGFPFRETTPGEKFNNDILQNSKRLFNTKQLPIPEPRVIVPNTQGTPNRLSKLYGPGGDQGEVGGMRQRTKPKK